ncbi:MAG: hypothetical protein RSD57_15240 [Comamonas sp.]
MKYSQLSSGSEIKISAINLLLGAGLAFAVSVAMASPAAFPTTTTTVKVDGVPIGDQIAASNSLRNTVVFDAGIYYLWFVDSASSNSLSDVQLATSTDGINFTRQGKLAPPANWWTSHGATAEPLVNYVRVSKVSNEWVLAAWVSNDTSFGDYSYNTMVWSMGASPANLSISQYGPLPTPPAGPGGNHVGTFGIVNGNLYARQDTLTGGLGRYALTLGTPPTTSAWPGTNEADLFTGTPWCWGLASTCTSASAQSYVHNYGRTLDQSGTLGNYYAFRDWSTAGRREKQLWYVESGDDGVTWGAPQSLFTNGNAVTVDGLPNAGNFSSPEVAALGAGAYRSYFSTVDACGQTVMVTAAAIGAQQGLGIVEAFAPSTVAVGGTSALTVTLSAPAATCSPAPATPLYTGLQYINSLPDGLEVVSAGANTCGGSLTIDPSNKSFGLSGVSLNAGASCTTTVNVKMTKAGTHLNRIYASAASPGGVSNDQQVPAMADAVASLSSPVASAPAPVPTLGSWGLMLLSLLATVLGMRRLSRRT